MAYDFDVRSAAVDRVRMVGFAFADDLAAARQDPEHRTHYWVRKLALQSNQLGNSSSSSARCAQGEREETGSPSGDTRSPGAGTQTADDVADTRCSN